MMINLISELAGKCAASGCEDEIRAVLEKKLSLLKIEYDVHKTIIAHKKGTSSPVAIVTAMDVPALFITHTEKNGFARFSTCGVDFKKLHGVPVRLRSGVKGSVWCEEGKDEMTDMFIDFGESTALEAEPVMIDIKPFPKKEFISGFSCGNYAAMAAVISAACTDTERDVYFIFLSRAATGRFSTGFMKNLPENTEYICVEKSAANDFPGEKNVFVRLGGGVCIRIMDKSLISSRDMIQKALSFSETVTMQREISKRNGMGGAIQTAYGGANVLSLAVPARYCDEICETVSISDILETKNLLTKFLEV